MDERILKELSKKCFHGRNVYNPYTGSMMYQPCGTCEACLTRKASARSMRVSLQASISKYSFFVTLTYDTKHVPRARIVKVDPDDDTSDLYKMVIIPRRKENFFTIKKDPKTGKEVKKFYRGLKFDDEGEILFKATDKYIDAFRKKGNLGIDPKDDTKIKYPHLQYRYGYICHEDVQLFMKRVRQSIKRKFGKNELLHTYVVSEYTPKHFRPHFHIIFCFDSTEVSKSFGQIVTSCWRFGRVDWSRSRGNAESYCAGYVNSFTCLPYHLRQDDKISPRSRFSNGFARSYFRDALQGIKDSLSSPKEEMPLLPFIVGVPSYINGRLVTIRPPRSVIDSCFLKQAGDNRLSSHELHRVIRAVVSTLSRTERLFKEEGRSFTLFSASKFLIDNYNRMHPLSREKFLEIESDIGVIFYYSRIESILEHVSSDKTIESDINRLYRFLLSYSRFIRFWRIDSGTPYFKLIDIIERSKYYYSRFNYACLCNDLRFVSSIDDDLDDDLYGFIMHPVVEDREASFGETALAYRPPFKNLVEKHGFLVSVQNVARQRCLNAVKHREINALNIQFISYNPEK